MSFEKLSYRDDPNQDSLDILDAARRPVMHVPFSNVLRPKTSSHHIRERQWNETIDSFHKEMERSRPLHAKIGSELEKVMMTSVAIHANSGRLKAICEGD